MFRDNCICTDFSHDICTTQRHLAERSARCIESATRTDNLYIVKQISKEKLLSALFSVPGAVQQVQTTYRDICNFLLDLECLMSSTGKR